MHPQKELFQSNTFPWWEPQPTPPAQTDHCRGVENACWFWHDTVRDQITPFDRSKWFGLSRFPAKGILIWLPLGASKDPFLGADSRVSNLHVSWSRRDADCGAVVQLRSSRPGELYCKGHTSADRSSQHQLVSFASSSRKWVIGERVQQQNGVR